MIVFFKHDDSGIRTQKTVGSVTTDYYLNGGQVEAEMNGTDTLRYFYDENGDLIGFNLTNATYPTGANFYYYRNGQNDIIGILNATGISVVSYGYDSWGKLVSTTGTLATTVGVINPYRYRGYRYDTETGLYYLQSRYYDPATGRFINADGYITTGQGVNSYNMFSYCGNNPVNRADPSGRFWREFWDAFTQSIQQAKYAFGCAGIISQMDSPLPGPGDVIAGAIVLVTVAACVGLAISTATSAPSITFSNPFAIPREEAQEKTKDFTLPRAEGQTYYHATSLINYFQICSTKTLIGSAYEGGYVFAWKLPPSKKALKNSGAHNFKVIISFKTNAPFEKDPGLESTYTEGFLPVRSVFPGPIAIWDIGVVG